MGLTVFPLDNYDSFSSLVDADTLIASMVSDNGWSTLTDPQKEAYLRQSTLLIRTKIDLPDTLEDDLKLACLHLSTYSIGKDMLNNDGKDNIKRKSVDGVAETEYFSKGSASNSFPSIVRTLLYNYGLLPKGTFRMERA